MQVAVPQTQLAELAAEPSILSQDAGLQVFVADVQTSPVVAVQPVAPHKQASVFAVTPSVFVQLGAAMHRQYSDEELHDVSEVDSVL